MTNEHKSIMKLVFSGKARHKRESASPRVVGAATHGTGVREWHWPFLLSIVFLSPLALSLLREAGIAPHAGTSLGSLVPCGAELAGRRLPLDAG